MNEFTTQSSVWDIALRQHPFVNVPPEEDIVALLDGGLLSAANPGLDIGCGNGRHLVAGAERGYEMVGVDISQHATRTSASLLAIRGLAGASVLASMARLPFRDASFGFSLSWCVLNHGVRSTFLSGLRESVRVVAPLGYCFGCVMSRSDSRYGSGREVAPHTFVFTDGPEEGVVHYFPSEEELWLLLADAGSIVEFEESIDTSIQIRAFHPEADKSAHYCYLVKR